MSDILRGKVNDEGLISITIDGQDVMAKPGAMVLEAAIDAGIYIPYLCYHQGMKPFAACRMCVIQEELDVEVEKEGQHFKERRLGPAAASCTMPVREGMVIKTTTDSLRQLQRGVMEMLISEHPHGCLTCHRVELCGPEDICLRHVSVNDRCVTCPKNDRCEFKDTVRFLEMDLNSPMSYKTRGLDLEVADPFYDRDYNLCIVCGRCVRVCEEVRGDNAITFTERAGQALVGTSRGTSLLESGCEFCGACLDVCPVGALVERNHKWDKAVSVERTICPHCPVGCQLNLEVNKRGKVIRAIPEINATVNRGQACFKGKFGLEYLNHRDKLRRPMIRRDGVLKDATWDEALALIGDTLQQYKGDQFAAIASARGTNETAYLLQKFTRTVMSSNNVDVDSNTRPGLARALIEPLGYAASTNTIWELEDSAAIIAVDANITEDHNVVGIPIKKATKKGAKLIVIDSREVELTRYAHIWLRPRPGTTLILLCAMLRVILDEVLYDSEFLKEKCDGFEDLEASIGVFNLDDATRLTGVPQELVKEAAHIYATSSTSSIVYALDNVSNNAEYAHVQALADLALLTGNLGKPGAGLYALRHGTNEQGAIDVGCAPDFLPGYQPLATEPGKSVKEAFQAARDGKVKAMVIMGDSPTYSNGEIDNAHEALRCLEFLVVHDTFLSPIAKLAHVVLPAATVVDDDGTYTNIERRVQLLNRILVSENGNYESESGWRCVSRIARQMGAEGFDFESASEVFDEVARSAPIYHGISYERLRRESKLIMRPNSTDPQPTQMMYTDRIAKGIQWPCESVDNPGIVDLYETDMSGRRFRLVAFDMVPKAEVLSPDFPLLLVPGRVLAQPERETGVINVEGVNYINRDELLEIHPDDAGLLGIDDGSPVEVVSANERLRGVAAFSKELHRGVVSMTFLFGDLATRLQASKEPNPMANVPSLFIRPVRLEKSPSKPS